MQLDDSNPNFSSNEERKKRPATPDSNHKRRRINNSEAGDSADEQANAVDIPQHYSNNTGQITIQQIEPLPQNDRGTPSRACTCHLSVCIHDTILVQTINELQKKDIY